MSDGRWQFFIDRGGTFTDVVGLAPDGAVHTLKVLSENPTRYADAAIEGIRRLLRLNPGEAIRPDQVAHVKMGTTVATNALLERKGQAPVLVTTTGFKDALRIGHQARPHLFALQIERAQLLYDHVIEVEERIDARGQILTAFNESQFAAQCQHLWAQGHRALAVVFLHAWQNPQHEVRAADVARGVGFTEITLSHHISPLIKFIPRGDTTVVDAYLAPILRRYVNQVAQHLPGIPLSFMQSFGGLTDAQRFQAKDAILSGPAGGIVGMAKTAAEVGITKIIGFDMGGTSTDVSHVDGPFERVYETSVAGVRLQTPMLNIHTVAAGGSSIIRFDGARLRIGPESAGANPGPACYRNNGPLTITDAHVHLGRIRADQFPAVFGAAGNLPIDAGVVEHRFQQLAAQMSAALAQPIDSQTVAAGALKIAVQQMANAIKKISIARGYNVSEYTLQCFGGAGAQLACAVADSLGMNHILLHPLASVLSAYGIGLADDTQVREISIEKPLDSTALEDALARIKALQREQTQASAAQGKYPLRFKVDLRLKYDGTDSAIECALPEGDDHAHRLQSLVAQFEHAHQQRFSFLMPERRLTIESVVLETTRVGSLTPTTTTLATATQPAVATTRVEWTGFFDDDTKAFRDAPLHQRDQLCAGDYVDGPAMIVDPHSTIVVEKGWRAVVSGGGQVMIHRHLPRAQRTAVGVAVDPILLEVFNNLFMAIAEQMGLSLQSTAYSVNIKERLDFSCALFDSKGHLIANAPHIPVHLGSMSDSIQAVIAQHPDLKPNDVIVLNDPYHGGTHLPDITVVSPVFASPHATTADFYVASRGHHADVGGITPGSMPAHSKTIHDEGVLIQSLKLVDNGVFQEDHFSEVFERGALPCRNPHQNRADLKAQIAANQTGIRELLKLVDKMGLDTVKAYMQHVQDNAEECVRQAIAALHDGAFALTLDNGAQIQVRLKVDRAARSALIDFTGTSPQVDNNFNAPKSITTAAVLYVFRTLVKDDIPLNHGCLKPLSIIVPAGSLLNPTFPAAVVAGNVETSSAVTNALYGALGVVASSQCTMNNFTFGNDRVQYYETIAGGSGAGLGFDGTAVVQTHMTNSRLTDPEVLEYRYPVRVESFAIRTGSGGSGQWRGGDGGERRIVFLEPMTASILSNNRVHGPFGLNGGQDGACGRNAVVKADGRVFELASTAQVDLEALDTFVIATPGGGGYGST